MQHPVLRHIDPPAHLSAEARQALQTAPASAPLFPGLADKAGWRTFAAALDARYAAAPRAGLEALLSQVASSSIKGVPVYTYHPPQTAHPGRICLSVHGGAFLTGGGRLVAYDAPRSANATGLQTFAVDYRMPPDHPYPAAVDDALACYSYLLQSWPASDIIVSGVSAGGNIAAAMVLRARDEGLPMPAGLVLASPELDLTESGDSFATLLGLDNVLPVSLMSMNRLYAGKAKLSDPHVSPLFADFSSGFPPTLLQSGTRDLFLSNVVRMHRALRRAGVAAELHVWDAMPHVGFGGATPEDREVAEEIGRFVGRCLRAVNAA